MAKDFYADVDTHGNKVRHLADGDADGDAVNRGQLDAVAATVPRITVSTDAPSTPQLNDLWVDLS